MRFGQVTVAIVLRGALLKRAAAKKKDHWVRWCPVFFLVGQLVVGKQWRCFSISSCCSEDVAAFSVGVHILFHMRRQVIEKGGLTALLLLLPTPNGPLPALRSLFGPTFTPFTAGHLALQLRIGRKKDVLPIGLLRSLHQCPWPLPGRLPALAGSLLPQVMSLPVGGTRDPVLMLMMQQHDKVWGTASAEQRVEECHCGEVHIRAVATQAIPAGHRFVVVCGTLVIQRGFCSLTAQDSVMGWLVARGGFCTR